MSEKSKIVCKCGRIHIIKRDENGKIVIEVDESKLPKPEKSLLERLADGED